MRLMSDISFQIEMKLLLYISAFRVTDPLKTRRKMSMVSVYVHTVYWASSIYILFKRKNLSYILDFLDVVNETLNKIQVYSTCIQEMSWPNFFYIFKTKNKETKTKPCLHKVAQYFNRWQVSCTAHVACVTDAFPVGAHLFRGINTKWSETHTNYEVMIHKHLTMKQSLG